MMIWLTEALIGATLLMLLVLAIRRPVARLWGAHIAYALWALPALRMLLPAIPGWTPLYVPVAKATPGGDRAVALMPAADAAAYTEALPPATLQLGPEIALVPDWPLLLAMCWAVGAAVFLAVQWRRHLHFIRTAVAGGALLTQVGDVDVIISDHVPGPMAAGIVKRRILLPADFLKRYSASERRLALLHEGAHHDRRDLAANLVGLAVLAAHWWNPVAHAAWRAFRADQELACDATVLAGSDGETRAAYAGTVLKSAVVATPAAACAMNHKHQLKERFAMMKQRDLGRASRFAGMMLVAAVATAALAATASGAPPAPPAPPVVAVVPPPAPAAPPAIAAAPAPPAPPAAPRKREVIVIKDGAAAPLDGKGEALAMLDGDMKDGVEVSETADGRRMVMIRRHADAELAHEKAADAHKLAAAHIKQIETKMRARCDSKGVKLPTDADIGQLATCGRDLHKDVREAMDKAHKAIAEARSLSDQDRAAALRGLEIARSQLRREVLVQIER